MNEESVTYRKLVKVPFNICNAALIMEALTLKIC
jgi:hypothetical protein